MNYERANDYVIPTTVILVGIVLALNIGNAAGSGHFGPIFLLLALFLAGSALLIFREKVWLLIPISWTLGGKILLLPLPFKVRDLAIGFVFASFLILKALKVVRRKPVFTNVDVWLMICLCYLLTVFVRNPVGVDALNSDRVGGRPYFDILLAMAVYWVLSRSAATLREAFWLPILAVLGGSLDFILNWIATHFPATAPLLTQLYSSVFPGVEQDETAAYVDPEAGSYREGYMGGFGYEMILSGISYWRPVSLFNPLRIFRFLLLVAGVYCILASGFRSIVLSAGAMFLLSSYFQKGSLDVVRIVLVAAPAVGLMILLQGQLFQLPKAAQRALSFLPGQWDQAAVEDAQGSTQWRLDMWKRMLDSDKYIENRWLGDGFGFTKEQFAKIQAIALDTTNSATTEDQQENFMIMGQVHSGPISTIRFVGVVGLIFHICLMIAIAREAWRMAGRTKGTPYFPLALFVGLPAVWYPLGFLFVFGGYENALPQALYSAGMLKMIQNSLDQTAPKTEPAPRIAAPRPKQRSREPLAPVSHRQQA